MCKICCTFAASFTLINTDDTRKIHGRYTEYRYNQKHMAKVDLATPFDGMSGKLSSHERIVLRTRYGRTQAYAILHPYEGPLSNEQQTVVDAFSQAVKQCKTEMSEPERLAYWQDRYAQYNKLAKRNPMKANERFIGTHTDKYYLTIRGFIIASLSVQFRSAE